MASIEHSYPRSRGSLLAAAALWLLFVIVFSILGWLLLRGCGLILPGSAVPFLAFCSAPTSGHVEQLEELRAEEQALRDHLRELERQLSGIPPCGDDCALAGGIGAVDLYFLQDLSSSFRDDLPNFRRMIDDLIARREAGELGQDVAIGLGAFIDKPLEARARSLGDYTFRPFASLTASAEELRAAADTMDVGYGGETVPESQFEAVIEMLGAGDSVGFRAHARKYVIVVTDTEALVQGDWPDAPAKEDGVADGDPMNEDYPTEAQVSEALLANDVIPIFLVAGPSERFYSAFVSRHGSGYVGQISASSDDLTNAIFSSLAAICGRSSG